MDLAVSHGKLEALAEIFDSLFAELIDRTKGAQVCLAPRVLASVIERQVSAVPELRDQAWASRTGAFREEATSIVKLAIALCVQRSEYEIRAAKEVADAREAASQAELAARAAAKAEAKARRAEDRRAARATEKAGA